MEIFQRDRSRGQTPHDYLGGIIVFIVIIAVIISLLPTFTVPFQSGVGGESVAQADRVAQQVVTNLSSIDKPNRLNTSRLEKLLAQNEAKLSERFGLSRGTNVNITVETLNGSSFVTNASGTPLTSTTTYSGSAATSTTRIVRMTNESTTCQPACRLVVRIW